MNPIDWVAIIALVLGTIGLCVGTFAALAAYKLAQYITASEQLQASGMENLMRLVMHIGQETDTLRPQGLTPTAPPPGTTVH